MSLRFNVLMMLAITINNNFLKIAAPERNLFKKIPLDSSVVDDCKIIEQEKFVGLVEKELTNVELPSREVLVGLNEEKTYLLESASVDDLSDLAPYEPDQLYITQNPKIPQLAAVEKELVDGYLKVLQRLGFKVSGFVPLALALANLTKEQEKPHLIVCLEDDELVFVLVKESGAVPFSATYSADHILESTTAVLEFAKEKYQTTDIKKVYICGEKSDQVAKTLKEAKLLVEELKIDPPEFCKLISLLQFDDPDLIIRPGLSTPKRPKLFTRLNAERFRRAKLPKLPKRLLILLGTFGLLGLVLTALILTKTPKFTRLWQALTPLKPPESLPAGRQAPTEVPEATETAESALNPPLEDGGGPVVVKEAEPEEKFDKSAFAIQVLNAKGVQGVAARARDKLEELGYQVVDVDNTSWRLNSIIEVKEGNEELLKSLTRDLEGEYNLVESEILEKTSEFDAVVVIGSK